MANQGYEVLVVEDEPDLRTNLTMLLDAMGYGARAVDTCEGAFAALAEQPPDLVLCDLVLPDGPGFGVIERAHALDPAPPVLVMTAFATMERAIEAIRQGAYDFLLKPFTPDELSAALGRAATSISLRQARERERQLRHVAEVALTLAHEINNPLAVLMGEIELQLEGATHTAETREALEVCLESGQRIAAAVRKIAALRDIAYADVEGMRMIDLT